MKKKKKKKKKNLIKVYINEIWLKRIINLPKFFFS